MYWVKLVCVPKDGNGLQGPKDLSNGRSHGEERDSRTFVKDGHLRREVCRRGLVRLTKGGDQDPTSVRDDESHGLFPSFNQGFVHASLKSQLLGQYLRLLFLGE